MSRSYREPYWTDNPNRGSSFSRKRVHARRYRRIVKQIVKTWTPQWNVEKGCLGCECMEEPWWTFYQEPCPFQVEPFYPVIPLRDEKVNEYDICDFRFRSPDDPRAHRK